MSDVFCTLCGSKLQHNRSACPWDPVARGARAPAAGLLAEIRRRHAHPEFVPKKDETTNQIRA